jgi:hypothetical protein
MRGCGVEVLGGMNMGGRENVHGDDGKDGEGDEGCELHLG